MLSKAVLALSLMAFGAWVLLCYLSANDPGIAKGWHRLQFALLFFSLFLQSISTLLDPARQQADTSSSKWAPAASGVTVVVLTGLAGALAAASASGILLSALILLITAAAAVLLWRFANAHAAEIGEARFKN